MHWDQSRVFLHGRRGQRRIGVALALIFSFTAAAWTGPESAGAQDILSSQLQQGFGKNKVRYKTFDWHVMESRHVEVLYEPEFEALGEAAVRDLEQAYGHVSEMMRHQLSDKPPIVIYESHYEFEQTNLVHDFLPPGVAGFAEPLRYRVVVPFAGDLDEFRRVLTHELTHIFQYDILYHGPIKRLSSPLRAPPTWIMEGQAEYSIGGRNTIDEMVLRDAVLSGQLIPLQYMNSAWGRGNTFLMYKEAESIMEYIAATYGPEKIGRILRVWDAQTDTDELLKRLLDVDMATLDERWSEQLRKHYWPLLENRDYLSELGRRVIEDRHDYRLYTNARWSLSGDMLAVLSSDGVEQNVDIIRLSDGTLVQRITTGMRAGKYDFLTFGKGTLDWSPDGHLIAFVAKKGSGDEIILWDVYAKRARRVLRVKNVELIESLAWAPDNRHLALVGTGYGQSDIYVLDTETGVARQLTGTPERDDYPAWSPDGKSLAFSSKHHGQFDISICDVESGRIHTAIASPTDDLWPQWLPEGNKILFVSTREKINDLFVYHLERREEYRLTRTLSGIMDPALSPDGQKIVVSTYTHGRSQLYLLDMPDWHEIRRRDAALRVRGGEPESGRQRGYGAEEGAPSEAPQTAETALSPAAGSHRAGGGAVALSSGPATAGRRDSVRAQGAQRHGRSAPSRMVLLADAHGQPGVDGRGMDAGRRSRPAGGSRWARGAADSSSTQGVGAAAGEDTSKWADVAHLPRRRYKPKLEFDGVSVQIGYYDGYMSSIAQLNMNDLLGNHSLSLATDYVNSQDINNDFNFALAYSYYGRRPTFRVAVFNWNTYYNAWIPTDTGYIGAVTKTQQTGFIGTVSYPLDIYRRIELNYTYVDEQQSLAWPSQQPGPSYTTNLVKAAYVHDSVLYGLLGPTEGCAYYVEGGHTLDIAKNHRSFTHGAMDYRRYQRLGHWSVLGLRTTGVASIGDDALVYNLGGPVWWTPFYTGFDLNVGPLRGYSYSEFTGTRVILFNGEVRVPLMRQVVFGWPSTFVIPAVDGSAFLDIGTAWNEGDDLDFWPFHDPHEGPDPPGTRTLRAGVGFGALVYFLLPLHFEWAKQTDLRGSYSDWVFHFSFGRSF